MPVVAGAAAAPCPTSTAGGEPAETCLALADRLDLLVAGLDQLNGTLGGIPDQLTTANARLSSLEDLGDEHEARFAELRTELEAFHADYVSLGGAPPTTSTVAFSSLDRDNLADATTAVRGGVWFLAGLVAALLASFQLRAVFRA